MAYDDDYYYGFRPYVSVAARRAQAARELAKLRKNGRTMSPVTIEGRKIARTFWGEAWCDNLERYSDYANRLPRGRTYVRNGSVVDLQVAPGRVTALVSGSAMYDVQVTVGPVPRARWSAICKDCSGAIDSLVELLQGRFSKGVMTRLCEQKTGPVSVAEGDSLHVQLPGLGVDVQARGGGAVRHRRATRPSAGAAVHAAQGRSTGLDCEGWCRPLEKGRRPAGTKVLASDDLSEMFGIEMAPATPAKRPAPRPRRHHRPRATLAASPNRRG